MEKEKTQFEFLKEDGKYVFVMKSKDIERREYVDKQYALDHYKDLKNETANFYANLGKVNKDLEKNEVQKDEELEHFVELANKAAKYKAYMDARENQKVLLEMIEANENSIKRMEFVIPELKRAKD